MRQHRSMALLTTGFFLLGLVGCAADSVKSLAETSPPSTIAQVEASANEVPTGEVQERAVMRDHRTQSVPMTPPATSQTTPQVTIPATGILPNAGNTSGIYNAPTPDLTAVANAISVDAKSLQILVTVKPGLRLANPVTISIGYDGPRQTQVYLTIGNRFVYRDPEGDGKPRRRSVSINLSHPKPGGGIDTFDLNLFKDLDPLYSVMISPLQFQLITSCALIAGDSDIDLYWRKSDMNAFEKWSFSTQPGFGPFAVNGFAWQHHGISASHHYHQPQVWFYTTRPPPINQFHPIPEPSTVNLVPGKTTTINTIINEGTDGSPACNASIKYTMTYTLDIYF